MSIWQQAIADLKEFTENLEKGVPIEATQIRRIQTPDGDMHERKHVVLTQKITPEEFHKAVAAVDLEKVPVMTETRSVSRKEQAMLARRLFKQLRITGASIVTPTYSMAQVVEITIPSRRDYTKDKCGQIDFPNDHAAVANHACEAKIDAILAKAFPNHDNRSDSMTDLFRYKWSIYQR